MRLAPDRPGQGLSDPIGLPQDRYRETAVAWLDGLVDALKLDAAALLGNSGGAVWALWYALAHPDRVKQLVLLGPPAMPMTRLPLPVRLIAAPGVGELLSRSGWRRHARVRPDELRQVAVPTLVVWGEQETLGGVSVAQAMTELIPHARLEVLAGGHAPWLGQPTQAAAMIVDLVR